MEGGLLKNRFPRLFSFVINKDVVIIIWGNGWTVGGVLESGFVRIDKDSRMAVSCSDLLDDSPSAFSSVISLRYTLPEILANGASHSVNLKFQTLGHFVNVCGSLSDDVRSMLHFVCLDTRKYVRPLESMLANSETKGSLNDGEDIVFGNEVFEMCCTIWSV